ncbi:MAG: carbohydrate deacetylase [Armatimonadota bacterium]
MPADALIINADDLGLWPAVDRGIFTAWSARAISDSTIFATASALTSLLDNASSLSLPVGIHLNLTLGRPLCAPGEIPALVTPDGCFMKRQAWALPLPVEQVRRELTRQVRRVIDTGWQPSHLDSHHHIHAYPEILEVVLELAREYGLPVRAVDDAMRAILREAGIATPDHFTIAFYGAAATVETLLRLVEECPGGTLEIMTHPGYADDAIPSSYREERACELQALLSPRWREYLTQRGIPLVGFRALTG